MSRPTVIKMDSSDFFESEEFQVGTDNPLGRTLKKVVATEPKLFTCKRKSKSSKMDASERKTKLLKMTSSERKTEMLKMTSSDLKTNSPKMTDLQTCISGKSDKKDDPSPPPPPPTPICTYKILDSLVCAVKDLLALIGDGDDWQNGNWSKNQAKIDYYIKRIGRDLRSGFKTCDELDKCSRKRIIKLLDGIGALVYFIDCLQPETDEKKNGETTSRLERVKNSAAAAARDLEILNK